MLCASRHSWRRRCSSLLRARAAPRPPRARPRPRRLPRVRACALVALDRGQAVALGEPLRRRRGAFGGGRESVPPPQIALARDEALAGLELRLQAAAFLARGDDAGLPQAAVELGRGFDMRGERRDTRQAARRRGARPRPGANARGPPPRPGPRGRRRARRQAPPRSRARRAGDRRMGGKSVPRVPISSLTSVSRSARREASASCALALSSRAASAVAASDCALSSAASACTSKRAISSASRLPASVICASFSASGAPPGDLARLRVELGELPLELGNRIAALGEACFEAVRAWRAVRRPWR